MLPNLSSSFQLKDMGTLHHIALLNMLVCITLFMRRTCTSPVDPTLGFSELPLDTANFHHDKPYNLPVTDRYSFMDGVHKFWVYSSDKPLYRNSQTRPRSEIRIRGYDYSSGVWQFEGQGFIPNGTSGVCIMQVFGADRVATTLMLRTFNSSLSYYKRPILVWNIWNRWFQLNVIHDVEASIVRIYVDGVQVYEAPGHGGGSHYFKFGVYTQDHPSNYMESQWKGIRVLKRSS